MSENSTNEPEFISVAEVATLLDVDATTVRRNIEDLKSQGVRVLRIGGTIRVSKTDLLNLGK